MIFNIRKIILPVFFLIIYGMSLSFPVFSADGATVSTAKTHLSNAIKGTGLEKNSEMASFIGVLVNGILGFLGLLFLIIIIYAGFIWTTAQGDSKKVDKAKDMLKNGIIGVTIVFLAYAIKSFIISYLVGVKLAK